MSNEPHTREGYGGGYTPPVKNEEPKPLTGEELTNKELAAIVVGLESEEDLFASVNALKTERARLKKAILDIDRLYEAGDTLQLRSLLANLRKEIG